MIPETKLKQLKDIVEQMLSWAKKAGADEAFVSASYGMSSKIAYEQNDFNIASNHEGTGFSITVHKDQRSGSASVNIMNDEQIKASINRALSMAEFALPDPYLGVAPQAEYVSLPPQYDERIVEFSMNGLNQMAQKMIAEASSDKRISIDSSALEKNYGARVIANSKGMLAEDYSSILHWSFMGMAIDGDDITSFDYNGDFCFNLDNAERGVQSTAQKFQKKLLKCLNSVQGKSYRGRVLLTPALVEELLVDPFVFHILGANIMDGKSRLTEHLEQKVCHESFSLEDHPHDVSLRGCTAFSAEGIPTREMSILENGVLKRHLDSVYTANRRKTTPTGNGSGPHSVYVCPGKASIEELKTQSGALLEPGRFSGNIDPMTGDFSGVAKGSHFYQDSNYIGPVKEVMISGNVFEILEKEIEFANQIETEGGSFKIPAALVEGVSVTFNT